MTARSMSVRTKLILRMGFCVALVALMVLVGVVMANAKVYSGAYYYEECGNYTEGDRLLWRFDSETGELVISGQGPMDYYTHAMPFPWKKYEGVKTIVIEDGITSISGAAFSGMKDVVSVTMADSVTSIGSSAFAGCISLTEITFPTGLISIGDWAFYNCDSLSSVEFPDGVETIGEGAFELCDNLLTVTMTDSVKEMGKFAFLNCEKLEYVKLSDSITVLREGALARTSISSIDLPKNLQATSKNLTKTISR